MLLGASNVDRPGTLPLVERPVRAQGQLRAWAKMRPAAAVRTGAEASFLYDQYVLITAGALGLILLALLTSTRLARRWSRPLAALH